MRNGGVGTISATANVNPAAIHELYAASKFEKPALSETTRSRVGRESKLEKLQARLNVVRDVFSNRKFPSMIAALKQAIAMYGNDPEWSRVRPPLIELTSGQAKSLAADLKTIGFAMPGIRSILGL
jgi:4-hydroxy-tetrahydrodipicolinate synthase